MRKVFLDELPRHGAGFADGKIDWKNSIGLSVRFIYDDIDDVVTIIDYRSNGKTPQVYLEYNGNKGWVYTYRFMRCEISNFINCRREYKPKISDLTGMRFGKLTVLGDDGSRASRGQILWHCICDCGQTTHISGRRLKNGHYQSCGCLRKNYFKNAYSTEGEYRKTAVSQIIGRYRRKAKERSLKWDLDRSVFIQMIESPCYYCGADNCTSVRVGDYDYKYNGIDRIDSSGGYEEGNVVACCKWCNQAKSTMSQYEFYNWVHAVGEHYTKDKVYKR